MSSDLVPTVRKKRWVWIYIGAVLCAIIGTALYFHISEKMAENTIAGKLVANNFADMDMSQIKDFVIVSYNMDETASLSEEEYAEVLFFLQNGWAGTAAIASPRGYGVTTMYLIEFSDNSFANIGRSQSNAEIYPNPARADNFLHTETTYFLHYLYLTGKYFGFPTDVPKPDIPEIE